MKAAPFAYSRPVSVEEACALLAADDNARNDGDAADSADARAVTGSS
jgi:hypothetical protein